MPEKNTLVKDLKAIFDAEPNYFSAQGYVGKLEALLEEKSDRLDLFENNLPVILTAMDAAIRSLEMYVERGGEVKQVTRERLASLKSVQEKIKGEYNV